MSFPVFLLNIEYEKNVFEKWSLKGNNACFGKGNLKGFCVRYKKLLAFKVKAQNTSLPKPRRIAHGLVDCGFYNKNMKIL
jgi:hypothetical protein